MLIAAVALAAWVGPDYYLMFNDHVEGPSTPQQW